MKGRERGERDRGRRMEGRGGDTERSRVRERGIERKEVKVGGVKGERD